MTNKNQFHFTYPLTDCVKNGMIVDLQKRVEHYLGGALGEKPEFHVVRNVAPNKSMICTTFRLPREIAYGNYQNKKIRT